MFTFKSLRPSKKVKATCSNELNTSWNAVASKMYDAAKDDTGKDDTKDSKTKTKGKSKKKDDAEIEDADFEVVD